MGVIASDFRIYAVHPALTLLEPAGIPWSQTAEDLLMATAAQETALGSYLAQVSGPALGAFQIAPGSLDALIYRVTDAHRAALAKVTPGPLNDHGQVCGNLLYAAMLCRLYYWFVPEALPPHTFDGLWHYYKTYYNTPAGAATRAEFAVACQLAEINFASAIA